MNLAGSLFRLSRKRSDPGILLRRQLPGFFRLFLQRGNLFRVLFDRALQRGDLCRPLFNRGLQLSDLLVVLFDRPLQGADLLLVLFNRSAQGSHFLPVFLNRSVQRGDLLVLVRHRLLQLPDGRVPALDVRSQRFDPRRVFLDCLGPRGILRGQLLNLLVQLVDLPVQHIGPAHKQGAKHDRDHRQYGDDGNCNFLIHAEGLLWSFWIWTLMYACAFVYILSEVCPIVNHPTAFSDCSIIL